MPPLTRTLYSGPVVHSLSLSQLEIIDSALFCVSVEGIIEWIERDVPGSFLQAAAAEHGVILREGEGVEVVKLGPGEFFCPGLVDTHTHAPQYPNNGLGGSLQLLDWLEQVTFPEEKKYGNVEYAKEVYGEVVGRTLNDGTTTSCYYATAHLEGSIALAEICLERGQRAFVGKCCMDRNCPDGYVESTSASIANTKSFLDHFAYLSSSHSVPKIAANSSQPYSPALPPLVQPIITPRFALSCTDPLLASLGQLASSFTPSLPIQTHLSENPAEVRQALELFPECRTYAGVYENFNLLGPGTILAHCVHLSEDERVVIMRTGSGVSHCPTSNLHLNSGMARVKALLDLGIKVGLGTDCSGGYATGMLSVIRNASSVSRCLAFTETSQRPLDMAEVFYLATLGGASLCRLDDRVGNFLPGKEFDALRIKPRSPAMWEKEGEATERVFERWLWCGDDRDIADVWVRGRRVGGAG